VWKSLHEAFELEAPVDVGVTIEATDILDNAAVSEAYVAARGDSGTAALILAVTEHEPQHWLTDFEVEDRVREALARYDELDDPFPALPDASGIDEALARVEKLVGGDPMAYLHRIDAWSLDSEEEEDFEFDLESLAADDVREAYDDELAARAERLAHARGTGLLMMTQAGPLRTYDAATALRELCPSRARVVRIANCSQAKALVYVGFGGWNACPAPAEQARVWEHWYRMMRGEPVVLGQDTLGAIVGEPVRERGPLVQLAREIIAYDRDAGIEGYLPLLAMLVRTTSISFWWD
jgi:Domain of unknown function (DUF4253)